MTRGITQKHTHTHIRARDTTQTETVSESFHICRVPQRPTRCLLAEAAIRCIPLQQASNTTHAHAHTQQSRSAPNTCVEFVLQQRQTTSHHTPRMRTPDADRSRDTLSMNTCCLHTCPTLHSTLLAARTLCSWCDICRLHVVLCFDHGCGGCGCSGCIRRLIAFYIDLLPIIVRV